MNVNNETTDREELISIENQQGLVRRTRKELELTQEELASLLDVAYPTVNRWERGKTRISARNLERLRQLLASEFDEIRKLDGLYQSIDSFDQWAELAIDNTMWERPASFLEEQRSAVTEDEIHEAIQIINRAAAVDTGALEGLYDTDRGLTFAIALQEPNWETTMRSREERLPLYLEAHLAAFDLASRVAASEQPITEKWIRELHEVLTGPQAEYDVLTPSGMKKSPLPKGQYKTQPNHLVQSNGAKHVHAPVDMTPAEMHRLVEETKTLAFQKAHPVLQAAYVHYAFVAIHPFSDGNGRVARTLASVFLRRGASIPLLIWADQRTEYFDALESADAGDKTQFVDFIFDRSIDAMTFVANGLGPNPEDAVSGFGKLYLSYGGLTFDELNATAGALRNHAVKTFGSVVSGFKAPDKISVQVAGGGSTMPIRDSSYRHPTNGELPMYMAFSSGAPAQAALNVFFHVVVSKDEQSRYAFRLESSLDTVAPIDLRLRDVHPNIGEGVTSQMYAMGRRALSDGLLQLRQQAGARLEKSGL